MKKSIYLLLMLLILLGTTAQAQNFLSQRIPTDEQSSFGLRYFRYLPPSEAVLDQSIINGVYDLNASVFLDGGWIIGGSIPLIYFGIEGGAENEFSIGNIEIKGAKILGADQNSMVSLNVYLPTAPDDSQAPVYGILTNLYEFAKYSPNQLTIRANYSYELVTIENLIAGIEVGPQIFIPTQTNSFIEQQTEIILNYNFKLGYKINDLALFTELGSWTTFTEEGSFGDNSVHQLNLGFQMINVPFQPGIFWSKILEEDFDGSTLGLKFDFMF